MADIIQDVGVRGIWGARWLLRGNRRFGKATSSVVVFFERKLAVGSHLKMRGRWLPIEAYDFQRGRKRIFEEVGKIFQYCLPDELSLRQKAGRVSRNSRAEDIRAVVPAERGDRRRIVGKMTVTLGEAHDLGEERCAAVRVYTESLALLRAKDNTDRRR
ncbi:hypothetical protein EV426DRAFT_720646 [Tirmania nivea]|nr:hypothetical protein EV426DRAFT_720646 [Tirmania nivea]